MRASKEMGEHVLSSQSGSILSRPIKPQKLKFLGGQSMISDLDPLNHSIESEVRQVVKDLSLFYRNKIRTSCQHHKESQAVLASSTNSESIWRRNLWFNCRNFDAFLSLPANPALGILICGMQTCSPTYLFCYYFTSHWTFFTYSCHWRNGETSSWRQQQQQTFNDIWKRFREVSEASGIENRV